MKCLATLLVIILLLYPKLGLSQSGDSARCERNALSFFCQRILPKVQPQPDKLVYSGRTENRKFNFNQFRPCGVLDSLFRSTLNVGYMADTADAPTKSKLVGAVGSYKITSRYNGKRPVIHVYECATFNAVAIVPIVVYLTKGQLACYYFFLSKDCQVRGYCRVQALI